MTAPVRDCVVWLGDGTEWALVDAVLENGWLTGRLGGPTMFDDRLVSIPAHRIDHIGWAGASADRPASTPCT